MSAATTWEDGLDDRFDDEARDRLQAAPEIVEIRRNGGLSALIGLVSSGVAIAYLGRAASSGSIFDWVIFGVLALVGAGYLRSFLDARTPLLVADVQGVRLRLGREWRGLPWGALAEVEHQPRCDFFHDGRIVLTPHNADRVLSELNPAGRRQTRIAERLYGAPFALPLGLATRVTGAEGDLTLALQTLAGTGTRVVESLPHLDQDELDEPELDEPELDGDERDGDELELEDEQIDLAVETGEAVDIERDEQDERDGYDGHEEDQSRRVVRDPRPVVASLIARLAGRHSDEQADEQADVPAKEPADEVAGPRDESPEAAPVLDVEDTQPIVASPTPSPLRTLRSRVRSDVVIESSRATSYVVEPSQADADASDESKGHATRVLATDERHSWTGNLRPIAEPGPSVAPLVIDDFEVEPASNPVIGPELAAARTRLGLTVDQLAERTRIRPHVIESIEVDDFAPCGGDFYARGHLRTLARILGIDAAPLLTSYDERYADAPISPRRVFEAELASGQSGGIRSTRGGPNWSILIAAIMTVVLAWSIARLLMDTPAELQNPAPVLNGSDGPASPQPPARATLKTVAETPTHLVVKQPGVNGKVIFEADVEAGEVHRFDVRPPVVVQAADGGAVSVDFDGEARGTVGNAGQPGKRSYTVR